MATEAGIEIKSVKAILDGDAESLSAEHIKGFATALDVDLDILTKAADIRCLLKLLKPMTTEDAESVKTKEMAAEADNLKQKYYGFMESMRPSGSFEEVKSKIYSDLDTYLFKNIEGVERYDWLDYDIVGTYPDYVVVCVYNREFKASYQINYTMQDGVITFGDMTQVKLGFEPV